MVPREVELVGVPTNSSGTVDGVARAPTVLREHGLSAALASRPGFTDAGDLALPAPQSWRGPSGLLAEGALITMIGRVCGAVRAARKRGRFPLLLGGDCPVMLGALAALQYEQGRPGLLFIDGHEDAWPPLASPTGEAADCELGLALGLFDAVLDPRLRGVLPRIRAYVIAIGPRDQDELAAGGVPTLAGQLRALIRPAGFRAVKGAAAALPAPWWLHRPRRARQHRARRGGLSAARRPDLGAANRDHLRGPDVARVRGLVGMHLQPGPGSGPRRC